MLHFFPSFDGDKCILIFLNKHPCSTSLLWTSNLWTSNLWTSNLWPGAKVTLSQLVGEMANIEGVGLDDIIDGVEGDGNVVGIDEDIVVSDDDNELDDDDNFEDNGYEVENDNVLHWM